jgi:ACT domain-containing protein
MIETLLEMKERVMLLALNKCKTTEDAAKALGITERTLYTFKDKINFKKPKL